jgi:hypothetical protein
MEVKKILLVCSSLSPELIDCTHFFSLIFLYSFYELRITNYELRFSFDILYRLYILPLLL